MNFFISFPSSKAPNPFVSLLNQSLETWGWREYINEGFWLRPWRAFQLRKKVRVVHFHWPEYLWRHSIVWVSYLKALFFILYFFYLKAIGYKVVFSLHNLVPHFGKVRVPLEIYMRKWLLKHTHLVIGHSDNVYDDMMKFYKMKPSHYVLCRHGIYENYLNTTSINGPLAAQLSSYKGIKLYHAYSNHAYKGSSFFLENYYKCHHENFCLVLTGNVPPSVLEKLKQQGVNHFYYSENNGFLKEETLLTLLRGSDYVVLPYKEITTSGAYFLALTMDKPVIAPNLSFFRETAPKDNVLMYDSKGKNSMIQLLDLLDSPILAGYDIKAKYKFHWSESAKVLAKTWDQLIHQLA